MPELISSNIVRANKPHRCSWHPFSDGGGGLHNIEPGELYERSVNHNGDRIYTWKACAYHRAAANAGFDQGQADELTDNDLSEYMHEWWYAAEWNIARGHDTPMPFDALATFEKVPADA
ncbi:MAG: hypothetical protein H7123_08120 [Thermoleophilia bacterium]|nr:hypothetical protein [Thermoleophilia bacterium]